PCAASIGRVSWASLITPTHRPTTTFHACTGSPHFTRGSPVSRAWRRPPEARAPEGAGPLRRHPTQPALHTWHPTAGRGPPPPEREGPRGGCRFGPPDAAACMRGSPEGRAWPPPLGGFRARSC